VSSTTSSLVSARSIDRSAWALILLAAAGRSDGASEREQGRDFERVVLVEAGLEPNAKTTAAI
jgi:hypothetical protein